MTTLTDVPNPTDLAPITNDQLQAVRRIMLNALASRGYPYDDAEDAVADVLVAIADRPRRFASKLARLDNHGSYFAKCALNAYRMRLRSEVRRRYRQEQHWQTSTGMGADDEAVRDVPGGDDVLALAEGCRLTSHQRRYLHYVFVEHLSIEEIASRTGTTTRAVRALLQRIGDSLHQRQLHLEAA